MKTFAISMTLAAAFTVSLAGTAQGAETNPATPAPTVKQLIGKGTGACPDMSFCLYENQNLNAGKAARIWVFPVEQERQDFTLRGSSAADQPTSAYLNVPDRAYEWTAYLFPDYQCGYEGRREAESIQLLGRKQLDSLNGDVGRAKRYGYFQKKGKWDKQKRWGVTRQVLNLNRRAGCVTTGSWNDTGAMRPTVTGDM